MNNPFVNLKKRGAQLPKGFEDLNQPKCEYCRAPAVAVRIMGMVGYRWCAECQSDLKTFAEMQDYRFSFETSDEANVAQFRAERQRKQDDFMRQRLKDRKMK